MQTITLQEVLPLIQQLSLVDKVRLIEQITPQIQRDLRLMSSTQRRSLYGLWRGLDITEDDIAEVRREMWQSFPRGDI
ncbi:MAG: hypothetical protein JXA33_21905 [Anaerolineae bacterium]|nr:hypothetical protein [Anaerolineae bacterium]